MNLIIFEIGSQVKEMSLMELFCPTQSTKLIIFNSRDKTTINAGEKL